MAYIQVNEEGRLIAWAAPGYRCGPGEIEAEMPEDFNPETLTDYIYLDGTVTYDPQPVAEASPSQEQRLTDLEEALELLLSGATE